MRAVSDTNVVVSRYVSPDGSPAEMLRRWRRGAFDVVVSEDLLAEYGRALRHPRVAALHQLDQAAIDVIIAEFRELATLVTVTTRLAVIAADPDDDKLIECAIADGADVIVTGDKHLLRLGAYEGISILSPADFLALLDDQP